LIIIAPNYVLGARQRTAGSLSHGAERGTFRSVCFHRVMKQLWIRISTSHY